MEQLALWITPALMLGLFALVRFMFRDLKENLNARMNESAKRMDELKTDVKSRFAEMNQRFDQVTRELADNRERMAKLEGALEGFLAGRRDRDAA